MKRAMSLLLVAALPWGVATAAAASLGSVAGRNLGAGQASVGRCDTAFTVAYLAPATPPASPANPVDRVQVGDIAAACAGGTVNLVVVDAAGARLASGASAPTVPVGGGSVTVTLDQVISGNAIALTDGARFVVVGP